MRNHPLGIHALRCPTRRLKKSPRSSLSSFHCVHFTFTQSHLPDSYGQCSRLATMPSNPRYLASRLSGNIGTDLSEFLQRVGYGRVHHNAFRRLIVIICKSEKIIENLMLAEVLSMGIKAVVGPLALWEAARTGASPRSTASTTGFCRTSTTLPALRLGQKDKRLATELGRELG